MLLFSARRLGAAALTFFVSSVMIFLLVDLAPGDPAKLLAERRYGSKATTDVVARVRSELGLDQTIFERYLSWMRNVLSGDFGSSYQSGRPVATDLMERVGATSTLILSGAVFALLFGIILVGLGAWRSGGWIDRGTRAVALLGVSMPMFFLSALLLLIFALQLSIFPAIGESGPMSWVLPAVALGCSSAAIFALVVRVLFEEALTQQYVVTARSVGARRGALLIRDALPNVAPQAVTVYLTQVGFTLLPGTLVVETIFAWPGIGDYFLRGILFRDFPVMQAVLLLFVLVLIGLNLAADLIQAVLDPRVRRSLQKGSQ